MVTKHKNICTKYFHGETSNIQKNALLKMKLDSLNENPHKILNQSCQDWTRVVTFPQQPACKNQFQLYLVKC